MKKPTVTLNKALGKTPLECLERLRVNNPEYRDATLAYAGRLDPMAEGKLLVLVNEECKKRDTYLGLDKEYEFEILLGLKSDTYDILGLITPNNEDGKFKTDSNFITEGADLKQIQKVLRQYLGKQTLPYPVFSSKTVKGKPLFLWALEEKLHEIKIPSKEVNIYHMECIGTRILTHREVLSEVKRRISLVTEVTAPSKRLGEDFRRKEVLASWARTKDSEGSKKKYTVLTIRCVCSSGTYMRTLAHLIGQDLGTTGLAWSITRTTIGEYQKLLGRWGFWKKQY